MSDIVNEHGSPQQELATARSLIQKMKRLQDNHDYKVLVEFLTKQIDMRMHSAFIRPNGLDMVVGNLYDRGEIAGLKIAANFAQILIDGAQGTVSQFQHLDGRNDAGENSDDYDDYDYSIGERIDA